MASAELINAVNSYENYIERKGIDEQLIEAYVMATSTALNQEKDREYGLKVSARAKGLINSFVLNQTRGMDIWALERYQQDNNTDPYDLMNKYYDVLRMESHYLFESFMLYMEKKRPYRERFYQPRINPLRQVAMLIQDLYDDKLDEGMVFCPGRIGKTQL